MSSDFQQCHSAIARDTTTTTLELSLIRVDARRAQALHDVRCNGLCASILSEQYQDVSSIINLSVSGLYHLYPFTFHISAFPTMVGINM